ERGRGDMAYGEVVRTAFVPANAGFDRDRGDEPAEGPWEFAAGLVGGALPQPRGRVRLKERLGSRTDRAGLGPPEKADRGHDPVGRSHDQTQRQKLLGPRGIAAGVAEGDPQEVVLLVALRPALPKAG